MAEGRSSLPHYDNSVSARRNFDPAYLNQFEVIFTFPTLLGQGDDQETGNAVGVLTEQVKKISGIPEITPNATVEQFYKFAKRTFAAAKPEDTTAELELDFEINLNAANENFVYNQLRNWSDIIFNPLNGDQGLKVEYAGSMTVIIYNKRGVIYRQFDFAPVYPMEPFNSMELDYTSEDIYVLTTKFKADAWKEKRAGAGITTDTGTQTPYTND